MTDEFESAAYDLVRKGYLLGGGAAARGRLIVGCMDTLPVSWPPMRWIAKYLVCVGSTESLVRSRC